MARRGPMTLAEVRGKRARRRFIKLCRRDFCLRCGTEVKRVPSLKVKGPTRYQWFSARCYCRGADAGMAHWRGPLPRGPWKIAR